MSQPSTLRWDSLLPFLLLLVIITLASILGLQVLGGVENVRTFVSSAGGWGPLVFILLKITVNVIAPLSGAPLLITGSVLFGTWEGLTYIVIGDILGVHSNFWIARRLGRPGIQRFIGERAVRQVDQAVRHAGGWRALMVASLLFSMLYDFISYAAGLSNIRYWHFFWITFLSCVPTIILYMLIGNTFAAI
jgi:uncharacterized membrane protein YdjX (TVP38/TMEM64 family)